MIGWLSRRPRRARAFCTTGSGLTESGFGVLELLIVVVIVCVVVAIGVPTLHARARESVLEQNLQSLGTMVAEQVADGYSTEYRPSGQGDPERYLSTHLETSLRAAAGAGFANPGVGAGDGSTVVNGDAIPGASGATPAAVFITDSPSCQHGTMRALPDSDRMGLRGTLIVAFNAGARTVDVFYVDEEGLVSTEAVSVPTG